MECFCYYLTCGHCFGYKANASKTKTQKLKNLQTLTDITPNSDKRQLWSKTKDPIQVKTQDMSDIYKIPEEFKSNYEVLNKLGYKELGYIDKGSFGTVSKAVHLQSNLSVAIKVIPIPEPTTNDMKKERLNLLTDIKNELYILEKVRHPHVIRMIQHFMTVTYGKHMSLHILMQLAEGGTLSQMCESKGPFDEPKCKEWFAQMLSGLAFMHKKGIAHRDLKQSNILIDETNDCLISDFGLSRLVWRSSQDRIIMSQTFCGTPPYIAPEVLALKQNSFLDYDARLADIWSLGVILFKMYENNYPFSKRTAKALKTMHSRKWHYDKRRHPSPALIDITSKMFEPDPQKRWTLESLKNHKWIKDIYTTVEEKSTQKLKEMTD